MIVRCSNCDSAFAVDDEKVENKKFAFTCPKCSEENVVDNKKDTAQDQDKEAILDEGYDEVYKDTSEITSEIDRDTHEEALVNAESSDLMGEALLSDSAELTSESDIIEGVTKTDDTLIDEPSLTTDELDKDIDIDIDSFDEPDTSDVTSELPPADDLISDLPLDDLALETNLDEIDIETADTGEDTVEPVDLSGETAFEETGDKIEDDLILDEMEDLPETVETDDAIDEALLEDDKDIMDEMEELPETAEADAPIELEAIDNGIDEALLEDDKDIMDEFEPLEEELTGEITDQNDADMLLENEIKTEEVYPSDDMDDDESITIDIDSLDIELEEGDEDTVLEEEKPEPDGLETLQLADETLPEETAVEGPELEEDLTLDIDSLDIELEEGDKISEGESPDELDIEIPDLSDETSIPTEEAPLTDEDEDLTLDLDTLDILLDESEDVKEGDIPDEDEKITLEDAGLTLDELTSEELSAMAKDTDKDADEDIKLTIDEIDPDLTVQNIEEELTEAETVLTETPVSESTPKDEGLLLDEIDDLPEIDIDDDLEIEAESEDELILEDELIKIDEEETVSDQKGGIQKELPDMVPKGSVSFSIDYSIKYSKIGALLRLLQLFPIGLIPHYIVFFIYNILSIILGFINHIIVISTGQNVEDFSEIEENTLRYLLSISSSFIGIVEEMPIFAGRDNIDYALQMKIIYPLHYSRLLAALRLSLIGILIAALPHLLILGLISLLVPFIYIVGIFSVLFTGRWPHFLFDFLTRYFRYTAKVLSFCIGIVDVYPPFSFD